MSRGNPFGDLKSNLDELDKAREAAGEAITLENAKKQDLEKARQRQLALNAEALGKHKAGYGKIAYRALDELGETLLPRKQGLFGLGTKRHDIRGGIPGSLPLLLRIHDDHKVRFADREYREAGWGKDFSLAERWPATVSDCLLLREASNGKDPIYDYTVRLHLGASADQLSGADRFLVGRLTDKTENLHGNLVEVTFILEEWSVSTTYECLAEALKMVVSMFHGMHPKGLNDFVTKTKKATAWLGGYVHDYGKVWALRYPNDADGRPAYWPHRP